ncbi:hypothetical protein ACH427_32245 [Streptomyces sp. NPDC020379]|uniref:hypothetical protein n=1 Tax=Streptomyces sp. NPDC020379 TaxID=3365071 RepID=UPI0037A8B4FD
MPAPSLETLAQRAAKSAETAEKDKAALIKAAVAEALDDRALTQWGWLADVARRAGISRTYLVQRVEEARPGWIETIKTSLDQQRADRKGHRAV